VTSRLGTGKSITFFTVYLPFLGVLVDVYFLNFFTSLLNEDNACLESRLF
jgi:hypothetical protein